MNVVIYITAAYKHLSSLCASEMLVNLSEADILFTALSPVCVRSAHPNWGYGKVTPFGADTCCVWRIPVVSYCICDSSLFKVTRETIKFDKYVGDVQV